MFQNFYTPMNNDFWQRDQTFVRLNNEGLKKTNGPPENTSSFLVYRSRCLANDS